MSLLSVQNPTCMAEWSKYKQNKHGLVVIGGDSRSRGREFESQYRSKLDGLFLALIPCEICSLKRLEIHLSNILGRMNEWLCISFANKSKLA